MEQNKKQTAIDWLIEKINSHDSHDAVILSAKYFNESKLLKYLQVAKEMEKEREHELKQLWFGRGIVAAKEDKISELKPKRE
jgi:hypothetical protein